MSTENDTKTEAPRTASDLIQEAVRVVNWTPSEEHSEQARYDAAKALCSIYAYWTTVAMETLRRINPEAADRVATHIDGDLDWGNACEHAYGWELRLGAGRPIPADAWPFFGITGQGDTGEMPISDELIEATAKTMVGTNWSTSSPKLQQAVRDQVRRGLEAADPVTCRIARAIGGKA